ncbi:MAG: dihydropteroate synthase [Porticoccaceae bacterium]
MTMLGKDLQIMGVMNITPDSFSDGGKYFAGSGVNISRVIDNAAEMVDEGVNWLDVGGESTRPGAVPITVEQELERVIPVIEALSTRFETAISVDTSQSQVIEAAAKAGAFMVNDVRALQLPGAMEAAARTNMAVCLMHMRGNPQNMQNKPAYNSVVEEVADFLKKRVNSVLAAGIASDRICLDPGFGFGKSLEHNLQLLKHLSTFKRLGYPLLVGLSRKSMIGAMTGRDVGDRETGTTVLNLLALQNGANIFRVHNVGAAADMIKIWKTLQKIQ